MDYSRLVDIEARYRNKIIALRRDLHQHPELSGKEERTAAIIAEHLRHAGLTVRSGIGGHGVVAMLGQGAPCVLLRADMDALPLAEQTSLPWASVHPGVAHACGHDFHAAWLVGTALLLQTIGLPYGSVKFIFQPAEETVSGAAAMIAEDVLDDPRPAACCGAHLWPELRVGQIGLRAGANLAAADRFRITVTGAGTHGAHPEKGRDPIPVAAEIILALQTLVSRRLDPMQAAVVSVCHVAAGSAFNIIPEEAVLEGTVRTLEPPAQEFIARAMAELCAHIASAHGCSAQLHYERCVPATRTDPRLTELARATLTELFGAEAVVEIERPSMGAEDFAFFLERCPGVWLWIGCTDPAAEEWKPLHHGGFIGDERCLPTTILALAAIALGFLEALGP